VGRWESVGDGRSDGDSDSDGDDESQRSGDHTTMNGEQERADKEREMPRRGVVVCVPSCKEVDFL